MSVYLFDGLSNQPSLRVEGGAVAIDAALCEINNTLALPKFGYASVIAGLGGLFHTILAPWSWNCAINLPVSAQVTWTDDSIALSGPNTAIDGFTVLYEGFYRIRAGGMANLPSSYFIVLLNGAESFYSAITSAVLQVGDDPSYTAVDVIVHLQANTTIKIKGEGVSVWAIQGTYLSVERVNGQTHIKVLSRGTTTTYAGM